MDYDDVTPLEWANYEFATVEYDYKISSEAADRIYRIMEELARRVAIEVGDESTNRF